MHALVGGTPAYLDMCVDRPDSVADFDDWVIRRLLESRLMFREGNALLSEEPELGNANLPRRTLAAIYASTRASGRTSPGRWARPDSALGRRWTCSSGFS